MKSKFEQLFDVCPNRSYSGEYCIHEKMKGGRCHYISDANNRPSNCPVLTAGGDIIIYQDKDCILTIDKNDIFRYKEYDFYADPDFYGTGQSIYEVLSHFYKDEDKTRRIMSVIADITYHEWYDMFKVLFQNEIGYSFVTVKRGASNV